MNISIVFALHLKMLENGFNLIIHTSSLFDAHYLIANSLFTCFLSPDYNFSNWDLEWKYFLLIPLIKWIVNWRINEKKKYIQTFMLNESSNFINCKEICYKNVEFCHHSSLWDSKSVWYICKFIISKFIITITYLAKIC